MRKTGGVHAQGDLIPLGRHKAAASPGGPEVAQLFQAAVSLADIRAGHAETAGHFVFAGDFFTAFVCAPADVTDQLFGHKFPLILL